MNTNTPNKCNDCGTSTGNVKITAAWKGSKLYYIGEGICGKCSQARYIDACRPVDARSTYSVPGVFSVEYNGG